MTEHKRIFTMFNITPKVKITVLGVADGQSRVKAIQALTKVTGMSLAQARYVLDNSPQLLCVSGCEKFDSLVMDEGEKNAVLSELSPFLSLDVSSASENVLGFGMTDRGPWETSNEVAQG